MIETETGIGEKEKLRMMYETALAIAPRISDDIRKLGHEEPIVNLISPILVNQLRIDCPLEIRVGTIRGDDITNQQICTTISDSCGNYSKQAGYPVILSPFSYFNQINLKLPWSE